MFFYIQIIKTNNNQVHPTKIIIDYKDLDVHLEISWLVKALATLGNA